MLNSVFSWLSQVTIPFHENLGFYSEKNYLQNTIFIQSITNIQSRSQQLQYLVDYFCTLLKLSHPSIVQPKIPFSISLSITR